MVCVYLLISFAVTGVQKCIMPVLYHNVRKCFQCDKGILLRILGLQKKEENEATENYIKRNFVNFTIGQLLLSHEFKKYVIGEACRRCGCNVNIL